MLALLLKEDVTPTVKLIARHLAGSVPAFQPTVNPETGEVNFHVDHWRGRLYVHMNDKTKVGLHLSSSAHTHDQVMLVESGLAVLIGCRATREELDWVPYPKPGPTVHDAQDVLLRAVEFALAHPEQPDWALKGCSRARHGDLILSVKKNGKYAEFRVQILPGDDTGP